MIGYVENSTRPETSARDTGHGEGPMTMSDYESLGGITVQEDYGLSHFIHFLIHILCKKVNINTHLIFLAR